MNIFAAIVLIVLIVAVASVARARIGRGGPAEPYRAVQDRSDLPPLEPEPSAREAELEREVEELRERGAGARKDRHRPRPPHRRGDREAARRLSGAQALRRGAGPSCQPVAPLSPLP